MKSGLLSFLTGLCFFTTLITQANNTIHIDKGQILSSCDEPIVMRGYNEMFIWSSDRTGIVTLPEIAKTGSNAVRLVWTTTGDENELDQLITNSISHHMIPVAELHDATGDFSKLQMLLDYWKRPAVLDIVQKHKKWLIVNIGNEVGAGSETVRQWVDYYKDAITQLRNAGIDTPLMIDCGGYGSFEHYFIEGGQELLDHDPLKNIIFSVHTYWFGGSDQDKIQRLRSMINNAKSKGLTYIIGEGPQAVASPSFCNEPFPYAEMIEILHTEQIGWLSWSWGKVNNNDCGAPNSVFDITTDGNFGSWANSFAEEISVSSPYSIQNTSVIPTSMISNNCPSGGENYSIRARGVQGDEQINLLVNEVIIETLTLTTQYEIYSVSSDATGTARVEFINDSFDRDVQIDYLSVNGKKYESEDQSINTGVWQDKCGGSHSEWIHCAGYIEYADQFCANPIPIKLPFYFDGEGDFCWEISQDINYVNSWETQSVKVNGVDFTNFVSTDIPQAIKGKYYVEFKSESVWGHFEAVNPEALSSERGVDDYLTRPSLKEEHMTISPNPSNGTFNLNLDGNFDGSVTIVIQSALGQNMVKMENVAVSETIKMNTSLPAGIYTVSIFNKKNSISNRLVIH
ncbi:cellulase family glycosylhydrolase [Reichenbachiella versicolor]|uniref:cellulase family glycosylhydrolase n=1 Tax=Reichenbachiella versicolor TaxID=1821036 RepID=UPI000D6E4399|nr:cellulase family glycosylhydrolase [Reichenbachiella versicolor]